MTIQNKTTLKGYFNTGDIPTEAQFASLIDTIGMTTLTVAASNASDGSKGRADYICDGTNDEVQIQAAIDALPAGGGRVMLSEGTFTLDVAGTFPFTWLGTSRKYCILISTQGPVSLEGVPGSTIIEFRAGAGETFLDVILISGTQTTRRKTVTQFHGIKFGGNDDLESYIMFCYSEQGLVDNCWFPGTVNWYSVDTRWISNKIAITNNYFHCQHCVAIQSDNNLLVNNIFDASDFSTPGYALVFIGPDYDEVYAPLKYYTHMGNIISSNVFVGGGLQLAIGGGTGATVANNTFSFQNLNYEFALSLVSTPAPGTPGLPTGGFDLIGCLVTGNTFTDCANGFYIHGESATTGVTGCIVSFNTFNPGPNYDHLTFGIQEGGGTTGNNLIVSNHFPTVSYPAIQSTGIDTLIYGNDGYKTEGKGAAAAVGDGGTIDHGLVAVPTVAVVSGSVAGEIVTVTTLDATHITVAIKKHDGSAGTAQTVYWRAYV